MREMWFFDKNFNNHGCCQWYSSLGPGNCLKIHLDNYMKEGEKITHCLMNAIDILMNEYKENEADVILALTLNWIFASIDFFFLLLFFSFIAFWNGIVRCWRFNGQIIKSNKYFWFYSFDIIEPGIDTDCSLLFGRYQTPFTQFTTT